MTTRALFIDRDGVVNADHGYVSRTEQFDWIDGVFDTVAAAARLGLATIVVTNQAGIGRGYYTEQQFSELTDWMRQQFADAGAPLLDVYYCPFHQDALPPYRHPDHPDRKPNPGMLLRAAREHGLALEECALIGDRDSDLECASRAGLRNIGLLHATRPPPDRPEVAALTDHRAAANWLARLYRAPATPG